MSKNGKRVNPLVGKVGWCDGSTLGLSKGHYVFVRRVYGDKCSVNTFTSIEKQNGKYDISKIKKIEEGVVYPIPRKDLSFSRFSGIHKHVVKNVPVKNIKIRHGHKLKRRHHHYIQKYMK